MIADWEVNCVFFADMLPQRHSGLYAQLQSTLVAHGVEVRLLHGVRDIWAADYCPIPVEAGKFVRFRYDPDYLRDAPELKTGAGVVKNYRGLGRCRRSEIILDGGNVVATKTKAILTDKIYMENPGWSRADLRVEIQKLLQVEQLIVIPKEPYDLIAHTDAMVRFVDEETVLVNDYSKIDPKFGERLGKVLRRHELSIEILPYFHERRTLDGIPSAVGCFTNYLRTEKVLLAPIYGSKFDEVALKKLESVFPGLPIIPLDCTGLAREGGVLNCVGSGCRLSATTK
jgi:agmatine deiminase